MTADVFVAPLEVDVTDNTHGTATQPRTTRNQPTAASDPHVRRRRRHRSVRDARPTTRRLLI
jgi:hypothetical protein